MSMRRPLDLSIRSTSSCTWAVVRTRLVSSWRPWRAMKTRLGSLIQTSSTAGSSRNGCSGPKPGDPGDQLADHRVDVGHRRDRAGQAAVVVLADHALGDPADERGVALRVDALAAHVLADLLVELLDELLVSVRRTTRGC